MGLSLNTDEFESALDAYEQATGKDSVEILNRAGLNVAYRAAQFTPVADAADIRSGLLSDPHLVYALTALSLKKRGIGKLPAPEFQAAVAAFIAQRVASRRYLRSGWFDAIRDLGGTVRGDEFKGSHGFANKATVINLLTEIAWILDEANGVKAESAEDIGAKALQEALDFVAADMLEYAQEKLAKTAAQYSA